MRVASIMFNGRGSTVTIWFEGAESQSDYCPGSHGVSQRYALERLVSDGAAPGCHVYYSNYRDAGSPPSKLHESARRFADKAGLPFVESVRFEWRATRAEAEADAALEPQLATEIQIGSSEWVGKSCLPSAWRRLVVARGLELVR